MTISEYELNGVDCDPFTGPFPKPRETPLTDQEIRAMAAADEEAMRSCEPTQPLPSIVRDVQADMAAHKCCDCGNPLENEATIHLHLGKLYCSRCYHAEAGS
jgi:hypothetical protein